MVSKRRDLLPLVPVESISAALSGRVLNIHRLIAHSPTLLAATAPMRNYLVLGSSLSDRRRELLILRTAHHLDTAYEWQHHVLRGRAAGLSDAEISRVANGPDATGWSEMDATLLRLVDQACHDQILALETTEFLLEQLTPEQVIDALFTVGFYWTLGTLLNTFDVPFDDQIPS